MRKSNKRSGGLASCGDRPFGFGSDGGRRLQREQVIRPLLECDRGGLWGLRW
jgi:hypothetical protein